MSPLCHRTTPVPSVIECSRRRRPRSQGAGLLVPAQHSPLRPPAGTWLAGTTGPEAARGHGRRGGAPRPASSLSVPDEGRILERASASQASRPAERPGAVRQTRSSVGLRSRSHSGEKPLIPRIYWEVAIQNGFTSGQKTAGSTRNGWQYDWQSYLTVLRSVPRSLPDRPAAAWSTPAMQLVGPAGVPTARSNWSSAPPPTRGGGPWT